MTVHTFQIVSVYPKKCLNCVNRQIVYYNYCTESQSTLLALCTSFFAHRQLCRTKCWRLSYNTQWHQLTICAALHSVSIWATQRDAVCSSSHSRHDDDDDLESRGSSSSAWSSRLSSCSISLCLRMPSHPLMISYKGTHHREREFIFLSHLVTNHTNGW